MRVNTPACLPRVVKRIEHTAMRPWVLRGMETFLLGRVCVDLAEERQGAIEVGVPADGADGGESRGREGCA